MGNQISIHTKTLEEFNIVLKILKTRDFFNKITFNDSWNRFKERTCISWPKDKSLKYAYCSYYESCSRYENFFTFQSFLEYIKSNLKEPLYYGGHVSIKPDSHKK